MIKVLFLCHGNICRSPMAEFCLKDMARKRGIEDLLEIESAATSREALGCRINPPALRMLIANGIGTPDNELGAHRKAARQITRADYERFDHIICMDRSNIRNALRIFGEDPDKKIHLLMEYVCGEDAGYVPDVADPWYTDDYETAWRDIKAGCEWLIRELERQAGTFSGK